MIAREDMLELTRRMTPARTGIDRMAGCYVDASGEPDGTFNIHFLKLSPAQKQKNLEIAKAIPFSRTNEQLQEIDFPGETEASGDLMRLLDAMKESGLKNDAMLETFYELVAERERPGAPYAIYLFHGVYDIPRMGTDKAEQWESEEIYEYLICALCPVSGDYEAGEPFSGFLYPSFAERSTDWFHAALYELDPGKSGEGLRGLLEGT